MEKHNKESSILKRKKNKKTNTGHNENIENGTATLPSSAQFKSIFSTIDENFGFINSILGKDIGLIEKKYFVFNDKYIMGLVYINSLTDQKLVSSQVIEPLLKASIDIRNSSDDILNIIQSKFIYIPTVSKSDQMKDIVYSLLNGSAILFIDEIESALIIESRKVEKRAVEKPVNEVSTLASMDSLTEDITTNCNLIMKRLPTPDLQFEKFIVGKLSQTEVKLLWLEGIANKKIIDEVRKRIQKINIDMVDGIGVLSELIVDSTMSVFATYKQSERPDVLTKGLSDGQFVILCNNSPFGLLAPVTFWDNFKTMDDYSEIPLSSCYLRLLRCTAFILAITISPLYLAFVAYNHSIVPSTLAINITTGREGVPFPSIVELLIVSLGLTIIREASLRIPGTAGYFIGTLAAVVIGQAAVSAGYVSASLIIVVAVSYISTYAISSNTLLFSTRLINIFLILLSGMFGIFGIINGLIIIIWHMVSLESFGVPYMYPLVPFDFEGMKDTIIRAPFSVLKKRLRILSPYNRIRMNNNKDK